MCRSTGVHVVHLVLRQVAESCHSAPLESLFPMTFFLPMSELDYGPWTIDLVRCSEQVLRIMHMPKPKACFSCIAPSSDELRAFEVVFMHSSDDLYHVCAWQVRICSHNSSLEGSTKLKQVWFFLLLSSCSF